MAADAVQLAVARIDRIVVAAIAPALHLAADSAVGERHQVNAEQLCSAFDLAFLTVQAPRLVGARRLEHIEQRVPELRRGSVAQEISHAEGRREVYLEGRKVYRLPRGLRSRSRTGRRFRSRRRP